MKPRLALLLLASLAFGACSRGSAERIELESVSPRDSIASVQDDDPEMKAATAKARSTLPEFEKLLASPPPAQTYIAIKAAFEHGDNDSEHMWLNQIIVTADGYHGRLENEPQYVRSLEIGQLVFVRRDRVSDWLAIHDGVLVGGYTMRVIRSRLSPEEQRQFDEMTGYRIVD